MRQKEEVQDKYKEEGAQSVLFVDHVTIYMQNSKESWKSVMKKGGQAQIMWKITVLVLENIMKKMSFLISPKNI